MIGATAFMTPNAVLKMWLNPFVAFVQLQLPPCCRLTIHNHLVKRWSIHFRGSTQKLLCVFQQSNHIYQATLWHPSQRVLWIFVRYTAISPGGKLCHNHPYAVKESVAKVVNKASFIWVNFGFILFTQLCIYGEGFTLKLKREISFNSLNSTVAYQFNFFYPLNNGNWSVEIFL